MTQVKGIIKDLGETWEEGANGEAGPVITMIVALRGVSKDDQRRLAEENEIQISVDSMSKQSG